MRSSLYTDSKNVKTIQLHCLEVLWCQFLRQTSLNPGLTLGLSHEAEVTVYLLQFKLQILSHELPVSGWPVSRFWSAGPNSLALLRPPQWGTGSLALIWLHHWRKLNRRAEHSDRQTRNYEQSKALLVNTPPFCKCDINSTSVVVWCDLCHSCFVRPAYPLPMEYTRQQIFLLLGPNYMFAARIRCKIWDQLVLGVVALVLLAIISQCDIMLCTGECSCKGE